MSNLLLPIGSLIYLLFCVSKWGWGLDKYLAEANKGTGLGMSPRFKIYFQFILPLLILVILLVGLGSWGWRALICAAVAVFVWFMARRSSSKSTIERSDLSKERTVKDGPLFCISRQLRLEQPVAGAAKVQLRPAPQLGDAELAALFRIQPRQQQPVRCHTGGKTDIVPLVHGVAEGDIPVLLHLLDRYGVIRICGPDLQGLQPPAAAGKLPSRRSCQNVAAVRAHVKLYFFIFPPSGAAGSRSPSRIPSTLTPKIFARRGSIPTSGQPWPRSHLLTA